MKLRHFFIPHPDTHEKAHLISAPALLVYILLFIFVQVGLDVLNNFHPGILGISSQIDQHSLIDLTNAERAKNGLPPLKENSSLDKAAMEKGKNMFSENYWAHYSPSGKTPWDFISASGYNFSYAGENLARSFYKSEDVVSAWMASASHRSNIVNKHYHDIGIAVLEGTLQGQRTTLVIQEFGTPVEAVASLPQTLPPITNLQPPLSAVAGESQSKQFLIDPYQVTRVTGSSLVGLLIALICLDLVIIRKKAVARVSSRHLSHLAMLSVLGSALINIRPGAIL